MKKLFWIVAAIAFFGTYLWSQQKIDVNKISAPATGGQTSANSDSVTPATDRGGSIALLYDTNTNGKTTLVAGVSMQTTYVRGFSIVNDTASTVNVSIGSGTGTNCGTTYAAKTPVYTLDGSTATAIHTLTFPPFSGNGAWAKTAVGENLCISTSAGVQLRVIGAADQF